MTTGIKRGAWIVIPAIFIMIILSIMSVWSPQPTAVADAPPPMLPAFDGLAFSDQLDNVKVLNQVPISVAQEAIGWSLVLSETFTPTLAMDMWSAIDNDGDTNGEYYWGTGVYSNTTVTDTIARAISSGANGISVTVSEGYTDSVDSWLILGPFSTEAANAAVVTFDYWFDATVGDYFGIAVSTDGGLTYNGERQNGGLAEDGWNSVSYSLNDVVGETAVYLAFIFTTDSSGNSQNRLGAYLDNINLYMRYSLNTYLPLIKKDFTPTPTHTPTPTNTPIATITPTPTATPQSGNYRDDFDDPDSGWEMRRTDMTDVNDWELTYTGAEELQLEVDETGSYIIVSPLVEAPEIPYNIEAKAKFTDQSADRHLYGIIFAANKDNNQCPDDTFSSCFNRYYWLRVEWDETNANAPKLEFMLRRVYGHSSSGNPLSVDLIGWQGLGNASPTDWHEWDIHVGLDGEIEISFNDKLVATATDSTVIGQKYFGVMLETNAVGNARVKFDYFKISDLP